MFARVWGCRGSVAAPGADTVRYGGNTSCVDVTTDSGARFAGWTMLRLPHEVKELFRDWLSQHYPLRADHVMSVVRQVRGGRDNDAQFGSRMRGGGPFADLIARRFELACKRLGLNRERTSMNTSLFRPPKPPAQSPQLALF